MWEHGLDRPGSRKECTYSDFDQKCDHVSIHLSTKATTTQKFREQLIWNHIIYKKKFLTGRIISSRHMVFYTKPTEQSIFFLLKI
jgi:hypothetical protein